MVSVHADKYVTIFERDPDVLGKPLGLAAKRFGWEDFFAHGQLFLWPCFLACLWQKLSFVAERSCG